MRRGYALIAAIALAGCADKASKEEEQAAKNTIVCQLQGERLVIRFDAGEARVLMPGGDRIILYQVPSASGARYSNGNLELRGKGTDFMLIDHTTATQAQLAECAPYSLPKQ
jgi:membrane-bound inhibitor of C-type lysozyme